VNIVYIVLYILFRNYIETYRKRNMPKPSNTKRLHRTLTKRQRRTTRSNSSRHPIPHTPPTSPTTILRAMNPGKYSPGDLPKKQSVLQTSKYASSVTEWKPDSTPPGQKSYHYKAVVPRSKTKSRSKSPKSKWESSMPASPRVISMMKASMTNA
jgi:hypothetical protein